MYIISLSLRNKPVYNTQFTMATFTLEQVQKHNMADDLWIVLHNKGRSLYSFAFAGYGS